MEHNLIYIFCKLSEITLAKQHPREVVLARLSLCLPGSPVLLVLGQRETKSVDMDDTSGLGTAPP